ncbi:MAG: CSLREA domain-containing protein, partial [Gemmobacter sp.]
MAIFTVTTGNDVVDPNDGLLSLREAVALANASPGADTIVFAPNVSSVQANSSANRAPITITAAGGPLTIRGDHDNDGQADVVITNGFAHHLTVAAGAQVTIVGVDFRFGGGRGAAGEAGANGREGQQGEAGTVPPLTVLNPGETMDTRPDAVRPWGAHGGNARSADGDLDGDGIIDRHGTPGQAGAAGGVAGGSILNEGSLTIVRSGFGDNRATGGPGGAGGRGGEGAAGLSGARGNDNFDGWRTNDHIPPDRPPPPGNDLSGGNGGRGSDGGNGGRGGAGGAGGDAGAAITNAAGATLTLVDVAFGGRLASGVIAGTNTAQGGPGGAGGGGGNGGASGAGGGGGHDGIHTVYSGSSITYLSGAGGLGGDSGNAGS